MRWGMTSCGRKGVDKFDVRVRGNPFGTKGALLLSIFETVKQSVTTRQAAERYGIRVERNGMCRYPFHDDSTPSMKLDRRYYCFGCGATGDVIDFVS